MRYEHPLTTLVYWKPKLISEYSVPLETISGNLPADKPADTIDLRSDEAKLEARIAALEAEFAAMQARLDALDGDGK